MRGLSRLKNGVASLAYAPRIHADAPQPMTLQQATALPGQARQ